MLSQVRGSIATLTRVAVDNESGSNYILWVVLGAIGVVIVVIVVFVVKKRKR
jgi:heme/copper-type cytochrome/quinol oxidase subunit 2